MSFEKTSNIYFLGIGGIGMSALARYFNVMGKKVSGYDKTRTPLTDELSAEGIAIHFSESADPALLGLLPENTLVVYTPAVPANHTEFVYFKKEGFSIRKRAEVLGMITEGSYTIAVAGTHGKTTTSSLIAHLLRSAGVDCSAFLGGITQNYQTNLFIGKTLGDKEAITVVEADEYDRSFLTLHPDIAVVTSIDADHLDIYGDKAKMHESYSLFAKQVKQGGVLIAKAGTEPIQRNLQAHIVSYSLESDTEVYVPNKRIEDGKFQYSIKGKDWEIMNLTLGLPGSHNVENSVAAIIVARLMSISDEEIRKGLASFKGVKRRFDYQIKSEKRVFIDDYAHHPEELKACISSVKELYPSKKITGVFQPHLFTRTRDFAEEFMQSLSLLDEVILLDIYPAREMPIQGITSGMLLEGITSKNKMVCSKSDLVSELLKRNPEVLLTLGAGDIDMLVEPIKKALLNN